MLILESITHFMDRHNKYFGKLAVGRKNRKKRAFDGPCRGSLELLTGTELPDMARKLRAKAARPLTEEGRHD